MEEKKKIAIVGAKGRFGGWFVDFFTSHYEGEVICYDQKYDGVITYSTEKNQATEKEQSVKYRTITEHEFVFNARANTLTPYLIEYETEINPKGEEKKIRKRSSIDPSEENYVHFWATNTAINSSTEENEQDNTTNQNHDHGQQSDRKHIGYYRYILNEADVILFAVPLGATPAIVKEFCAVAKNEGLEEKTKNQFWMDVATLKENPIEEMLKSNASVVGLHPMTGPPIESTLKGKILVFCPRRFNSDEWLHWFNDFLRRTEAKCTRSSAQMHDRKSCFLQTLIHASHLIMAGVLTESEEDIRDTIEFKTPPYNFALSVMSRVLYRAQSNPGMYSEIQLLNRDNTREMFEILKRKTDEFVDIIETNDQQRLIDTFFGKSAKHFGGVLGERDRFFDRIAAFMADLSEGNAILIEADKDEAGLLHDILAFFSKRNLNMTSLHSFKTEKDRYQFWIGLEKRVTSTEVDTAIHEIIQKFEKQGRIIRVLPSPGYD